MTRNAYMIGTLVGLVAVGGALVYWSGKSRVPIHPDDPAKTGSETSAVYYDFIIAHVSQPCYLSFIALARAFYHPGAKRKSECRCEASVPLSMSGA